MLVNKNIGAKIPREYLLKFQMGIIHLDLQPLPFHIPFILGNTTPMIYLNVL